MGLNVWWWAQVADFGLAKFVSEASMMKTTCGTVPFRNPPSPPPSFVGRATLDLMGTAKVNSPALESTCGRIQHGQLPLPPTRAVGEGEVRIPLVRGGTVADIPRPYTTTHSLCLQLCARGLERTRGVVAAGCFLGSSPRLPGWCAAAHTGRNTRPRLPHGCGWCTGRLAVRVPRCNCHVAPLGRRTLHGAHSA